MMEESQPDCTLTSSTTAAAELHMLKLAPATVFNLVFAVVYGCGILALLCHHFSNILCCKSITSITTVLSLLAADVILAFLWLTKQTFRVQQIRRNEFPESLEKVISKSEFPAFDVFICTADPYKEPPIDVVNTALSVMAYDYHTEKISVYISDDGGSQLTLFAFMEAAKFATHWLPFCKKRNLLHRRPETYFASNHNSICDDPESAKIKATYESMKMRVEHVMEKGKVDEQFIMNDEELEVFNKWRDRFTRQDHPSIIRVLIENRHDRDITGQALPNLIYLSREKSKIYPHNFKAGALNTLLRVSAAMTNAPLVLTLDCDSYSNDPTTLYRVLCYMSDPEIRSTLAYVQFPQRFAGLNRNDIYAGEHKALFITNSEGLDGLKGPNYVGSGCVFQRRAFFGGPSASSYVSPEILELSPEHVVNQPIKSASILDLANHLSSCNYEHQNKWGTKIGFRYGSLVEDYFTGYRMKCEGWKSLFCNPARPVFLGDAPINLLDGLNQCKRWSIGLLQVTFSRFNPITFGSKYMGPLMGLGYAHYAFWPFWSIPLSIYAFLPQIALLNGINIFPKMSEPWSILYLSLFAGAYVQDCLVFLLGGGTMKRWWNDQRMWMIRGISCFLFGPVEFMFQSLGISTQAFNVTSKVQDDEHSKRYEQEIFVFGVASPMFVPMTMAAVINFVAFVVGLSRVGVLNGSNQKVEEGTFLQTSLAGFVVVNCWPVYKAMVLRSDKGKMPLKITVISICLVWALCALFSLCHRLE